MFIQMAVSMLSTRIMGRLSDLKENSSTMNTAPIAIRLTLTVSAVIVSMRS